MTTHLQQQTAPSCFGQEWDRNEPECAGGPDAAYIHPKTGQHIRDQCNFFQSCGARTQVKKMQAPALVAPQQLVRPPVIPTVQAAAVPAKPPTPQTPAAQPQNFSDFLRHQQAAHIEAQRQAALTASRPQAPAPYQPPQHQQQQQPAQFAQYPAPAYQLNYMMPGYLSAPEVRHEGEGLLPVLGREVIRSVFKALGHSVSHFFDVRVMKP